MAVQRHFLGWDAPVLHKVRDYLVPDPPLGPVDLRGTLVLIPTQQAGRRLRMALTLLCSANDTYLMAPALRTPAHLLSGANNTSSAIASPIDVAANWARVFLDIEPSQYPGLFPSPVPLRDFRWALHTGRMLESLRQTLAEHGLSIRSTVDRFGNTIEELDRWSDMAALEQRAVEQIERLGLLDPCCQMLHHAEQPSELGFDRVVLACVPDPAPLSLMVLEKVSETTDIDVLVHAPQGISDHFDSWGRPLANKWMNEEVEFPEATKTIRLGSSPAGQALLAVEILEDEQYGPGDVALGIPDNAVGPYLESALADHGVPVYNPAGASLSLHPVFRLLSSHLEMFRDGSYESLASFLRHPDVLDYLDHARGIQARNLLTELDEFQNTYLPGTLREIIDRISQSPDGSISWPMLAKVVPVIDELIQSVREEDAETVFRTVLQTLYSTKALRPEVQADDEFRTVADRVDEGLRLISSGCVPQNKLEAHECCELLLEMLAQERYTRERPAGAIDLEGWLELSWNDAPLLILTGMNDSAVPQRLGDDAFAPESLRRTVGLRNEADRLARDVFLARGMVESRRRHGRLYAISGKYGPGGEPLKPSRILLRCDDHELPLRARRLFGDPDDTRPSVPSSISFVLKPHVPPAEDRTVQQPTTLSATSLRDYLACPFRFYLKHVLRMESIADTKRELDALDFGTIVHEVLASMASDTRLRGSDDPRVLSRFLNEQVDRWATEHLGTNPPLHLTMQLDVIRDRLMTAARVQAEQARLGWEIIYSEERMELTIGSMSIRGRIDRVERHRDTGKIRVLDYKTTESPDPPAKQHLAADTPDARDYSRVQVEGRTRRWTDLQLPLYVAMVVGRMPQAEDVSAGYFNLPRDTDATDIDMWAGLTEPILRSAMTCASGILEDIENRRFWPPSAKVAHDDYESLLPAEASQCIDGQEFTEFLGAWSR